MAARRKLSLKLFHFALKILFTVLAVAALWLVLGLDWIVVWFLALSVLEMRHRRVRLWCPACQGGEKHDSDVQPEVPLDSGVK